jgi:glyoxylase-like metal-dependent hydrolase (beta-lactamase superfamily II)
LRNWKTKNGYRLFQVLSGRSNSYLISSENLNILVDTGKVSAYPRFKRNMDSLKLSNQEISFLILSHTHFDHCQSARKIAEQYHPQIIVSGRAIESIEKGYTTLPNGTMFITKLISRFGRVIGERKYGYQPFQPDILVQGNHDLYSFEIDIKIIETEGHSLDSISIIVDNEIAIVGDAMFGVFKNSIFPPYADDTVEMIKSWGKLLESQCNLFLPGHGKEVKRELLQKEYDKNAPKYNL